MAKVIGMPMVAGGGAPESSTDGARVGILLRTWREGASRRLGHPVLQRDVARVMGKSLRWVRDLETGAVRRTLTRDECDAVAELLELDGAQRRALLLANIGGAFRAVEPAERRVSPEMQELLDGQSPSPAYVADAAWNVLGYNQPAADWFPWIARPGANVMRWILLDAQSHEQHIDWKSDEAEYLQILRGAVLARPYDTDLRDIVEDVKSNPILCCAWDESAGNLSEHRDGDLIRMTLPIGGGEIIDFVMHVLYPASMPDCRMTVLTRQ